MTSWLLAVVDITPLYAAFGRVAIPVLNSCHRPCINLMYWMHYLLFYLLQVLAKKFGCSAPWTDVQKTAAIAGATAAAGLGLAWLLKSAVDWFSSKEDEDKEKKKDSH